MRRIAKVGVCAAIFAMLGPILGAAFFFGYIVLTSPGSSSLSDLVSGEMSLFYFLLIFGAYVLGTIPAAATGFTFGLVVARNRFGRLQCMAVGAIFGLLIFLLFQLSLSSLQDVGAPDWVAPFAGAFSGSLCGLVCSNWVGPNSSFKPKPLRGSA